jgi:basic membrane protein A
MKRSDLLRAGKSPLLIAGFVAFSLVFGVLASSAEAAARPRIAVIYDNGGRGDGSINDATGLGVDAVKKKFALSNLDIREIVTDGSESDRENRLQFLAKAGYGLIVAVGPTFATALEKVAPNFPNAQFAIFFNRTVPIINVSSVTFNDDEGAFLAGVAASQLSKTGKIGILTNGNDLASLSLSQNFKLGATFGKPATRVFTRSPVESPAKDVAALSAAKVDVIYSTWSTSAEVIAAITKINGSTKKIQIIGHLPDQYVLASSAAKKFLLGTVIDKVSVALVDLVGTTFSGQTLSDIVDEKLGVYGHIYSIADGGIDLSLISVSAAISAKLKSAKAAIVAGKLHLLA